MKNLFFGLLVWLAFSANDLKAQGTIIGVVDADAVVQKSIKGKAFFDEINAFQLAKRNKLDAMVTQYQDKSKDAQAKAASMSETKRQEVALELQNMQTQIKRSQEDAERESQMKINDGLEQMQKELAPLIRQVALEMGLDLVLNYGPNSNIVYMNDKVNITENVIRKYDEMSR